MYDIIWLMNCESITPIRFKGFENIDENLLKFVFKNIREYKI